MRLIVLRGLTVAVALLGGAGAMAFPKLMLDESVPQAELPSFAARAPQPVPVIRVVPVPSGPRGERAVPHRPPAPKRQVVAPVRSAAAPPVTRTSVVRAQPRPEPSPAASPAPAPAAAPPRAATTPAPARPVPPAAGPSADPVAVAVVRTLAVRGDGDEADEGDDDGKKRAKKGRKPKRDKHKEKPDKHQAPVPVVQAPEAAPAPEQPDVGGPGKENDKDKDKDKVKDNHKEKDTHEKG